MKDDSTHRCEYNTRHAPAERRSRAEVEQQLDREWFQEVLQPVFDALPNITLLLNKERQILASNEALVTALSLSGTEQILGARPGEAMGCIHAKETPGGCGTAEACRVCGAVNAILTSQQTQQKVVRECRVAVEHQGELGALDLRVTATPGCFDRRREFTIVSITDISHELRQRALERIFFHDVINSAGGLKGLIDLAAEDMPEGAEGAALAEIQEVAADLVAQIEEQQDLLRAEGRELRPRQEKSRSLALLSGGISVVRGQTLSRGREIEVAPDSPDLEFTTDPVLVKRVLVNMLKNACEAGASHATVHCGCRLNNDMVEFWVQNAGVIPPDAQLQIFKRSFSTKGAGRGLGTYSMKLISTRYLQGDISFTSTAETGTTFVARYPLNGKPS